MDLFQEFLQQSIEVKTTGKKRLYGILVEIGTDIIVVYNGEDYVYIPNTHVLKIRKYKQKEISWKEEEFSSMDHLSLRKILTNSKGVFAEINVTGSESIHGYVTSILSDYFVFYSPVYKTLFIPFRHLKSFIPYQKHQTPYSLKREKFPINPSGITVARTLNIQLEKLVGRIIILDLGLSTDKIGQLKSISGNYLELATARGETVYININHVKSVHFQ